MSDIKADAKWLVWKDNDEKLVDNSLVDFLTSKKLSTKLLIDAAIASSSPHLFRRGDELKSVHSEICTISEQVKLFESKVWFPSLQKYIQSAKYKGHRGCTKRTKILVWACLGRVMITFRDKRREDVNVTIMADEDSNVSRAGLHSISATIEEAIALIKDATENWAGVKTDQNISMI